MKSALLIEAKYWKTTIGVKLSEKYGTELQKLAEYIATKNEILNREIKDLEDVRLIMKCLSQVRDDFVDLDMRLNLANEVYEHLRIFEIEISLEEEELIDNIRNDFNAMIKLSIDVQMKVGTIQLILKAELIGGQQDLKVEVSKFDRDFDEIGPMVPEISAQEASERFGIYFHFLYIFHSPIGNNSIES